MAQPAKHLTVPSGATHFHYGFVSPFEKHENNGNTRYRYVNGQWVELHKHPLLGWGRTEPTKIEPVVVPENAKRVTTPHGDGLVVGKEFGRLLVDLDNNPFTYRPAAYFPTEVIA